MPAIAITSTAVLTPLDTPERSTFDAILAGVRIVDRGIISDEMLAEAAPGAAGLQRNRELDKSTRLAGAVADRAIAHAGWIPAVLSNPRTALFVGTSKGPALSCLAALDQVRAGHSLSPMLARHVALGPHAIATFLAEHCAMTGTIHTSVAACSSGMHAVHRAVAAIGAGDCDRSLIVAADASVHPLFEASFKRLGILAPPDADGHRRCRPFDPAGAGFILSEAAAALTIERLPLAPPTGAPRDLQLEASWIGGDSTHLLATDPSADSLRRGLAHVAGGQAVDFVHAHATGTPHDAHELTAIRAMLGPATPAFSHKGHVGHSLGAAGLVALALSAQCHLHRKTLEGKPLPAHSRSITVSQGFGGHIALIALQS